MIGRRGFVAGLLASTFGPPALAGKGDRTTAPNYSATNSAIGELLASTERFELPIERVRVALKTHYVDNNGTIYWIGTGRMTPFIQRVIDAADDGLLPSDYPIDTLVAYRDSIDPNDPHSAAHAELYFSAFFVAYASDLKIGRVVPQRVDPGLFRNRKTIDALNVLTDLKKYREPGKYLAVFEPRNPHYQGLKQLLRLYRDKSENGSGWGVVDLGPNLNPGIRDSRIIQIRNLLKGTGDYEWQPVGDPAVYDQKLAIAVMRFQTRHGLEAKGLIGKQTIFAMNVPIEERVKQIMLNMERWRWMPENLGDYHFMVNIAAFELQRVQSNVIVERMPVVVGAPATQTPEFSDELEYVELNPTWTVPYAIATGEMQPRLIKNPLAYADDFDVFMNGQMTSWGAIDWSAYGRGNFPFTFRQRPGLKNALGKVKFMLPNQHNIYLHDTPAKDKFRETSRAFSHGCIRLSRPAALAYTVLGELAGWDKARVDAVWATGKTTQVPISQHIPVHLIYASAFLGDGGLIEFRPDVYGRDRKLYNALFGRPTA